MCNALMSGMHYCTFHRALNSESVLGIHAYMPSQRLQSHPGPCNEQGISEGGQLGNCCTPTNEKVIMQTEKLRNITTKRDMLKGDLQSFLRSLVTGQTCLPRLGHKKNVSHGVDLAHCFLLTSFVAVQTKHPWTRTVSRFPLNMISINN